MIDVHCDSARRVRLHSLSFLFVPQGRFKFKAAHWQMCKHILNAQVAIRAPCCRQWYDCAECHAEAQTHPLAKTAEMAFLCKKCKKAFRKDMAAYEESDEYCPHCDNHYVIEAKTPQAALAVEMDDVRRDPRMLRDDRVPIKEGSTLSEEELAELLDD